MKNLRSLLAILVIGFGASALPALAQEAAHETPIARMPWTFGGPFGKFDEHQLQRGFQVFREVCSGCHSARLLAFRNLDEEGGPGFSEEQVKALAASYTVNDPDAQGGTRKATSADRWPGTGQSDADLKASFGIVPPDFSVLAKARTVEPKGIDWFWNYFTTYSEGGPDYIHALLNGYEEPPAGVTIPEGKHYNKVFPGHAIGMPPPLSDGQVTYAAAEEGETAVPETVEQYSEDVSAFMMWLADPHAVERKSAGFRVILFLIGFAVLMYLTKNAVWRKVH